MADWLKIEKTTPRKKEMIALSRLLGISRAEAFDLCFDFWSWADTNFADGVIDLPLSALDSALDYKSGFAAALVSVGWLQDRGDSLVIPHFDRHLGQSAKKRASDAERKGKKRRVRKMSALEADKNGTPSPSLSDSSSLEEEKGAGKGETVELSPVDFDRSPGGLARNWRFQLRRQPDKQDMDAVGQFEEWLRLGISPDALLAAIKDGTRDRTEYLWQFKARVVEKRTNGQAAANGRPISRIDGSDSVKAFRQRQARLAASANGNGQDAAKPA